ncbi:FAD-dependent oxidoreductase, partial [Pyxidicoccus sp. 3LFB2]
MSERRTLRSLWTETAEPRSYPPLQGDVRTDVVVIGAGVAGLTTAYLLAKEGRKVLVLDMHELCSGQTGQTTAHLTEFLDERYHTLERDFGQEGARVAATSARAAIETIGALVQTLGIDCQFERLPAYLYASKASHAHDLERELDAARRAGVDVSLTQDVPLPFHASLALRAESQAQLHPRRYLLGLADAFVALGGRICEHTRVLEVEDGSPARVHTERGTVTCEDVVEATTTPLNRVFLHTKLYPYRTYALAGRPGHAPAHALFYDTEDPYHYIRPAGDLLIIGGEDHKVGDEEDTTQPFARLESYARQHFGLREVTHRWSGQVIEPADGLPYIGRNSLRRHTWVATGFSGTGITFGTVAGLVLRDQLAGRDNPFGRLFTATRVKPLAAAMEFMKENAQVGYHFVADRLRPADAQALSAVRPGEGAIVELDGKKAAVYRAESGEVHALSPVCTHLGCHVNWNKAEKSWDCPCHGARYSPSGEVLNGPASRALAALPVPGLNAAPRT